MASYPPPTSNPAIFDSQVYKTSANASLTVSSADKRYVKYPTAQGAVSLQDTTVNGTLTTKQRPYQELKSGVNWDSVQGYYGLDKQVVPMLGQSAGNKAVSTWNLRQIGNQTWNACVYAPALQLWVVVGDNGAIATSPDGITFTSQTSGTTNNIRAVCWSPEQNQFVASCITGTGQRVLTSSNGTSWTLRNTPVDNNWRCVKWIKELGLYVACSASSTTSSTDRCMTSPDGINWTIRQVPEANICTDIDWSPTLGLAVMTCRTGTNRINISTDCINWTAVTVPLQDYIGVAWSRQLNLFVCCTATGISGQRMLVSSNGTSWTGYAVPDNSHSFSSICWCDTIGQFISVSQAGTGNRIVSSSNGISWVARSSPADYLWINCAYSSELGTVLAISQTGGTDRAMTSMLRARPPTSYNVFDNTFNNIDGNGNWQMKMRSMYSDARASIVSSNRINQTLNSSTSITNNTNGFYALDRCKAVAPNPTSLGVLSVSSWNIRSSVQNNTWMSVCYSPQRNLFVAVSTDGTNRVQTSTNGTEWVARSPPTNRQWVSVCWADTLGLFVAIGAGGTGDQVMTSPDGINWTTRAAPVSELFTAICWSTDLNLLVAVSQTGTNRVVTSPDGINWTARTASEMNTWQRVIWCSGLNLFVACSNGGTNRIMVSSDGINWQNVSVPALSWYGLAYSNSLQTIVATSISGTGNRAMYSRDGLTWISATTPSDLSWLSVAYSDELQLFVSASSSASSNDIMTSPDGINWTLRGTPSGYQWTNIVWSAEWGIFVCVAGGGGLNFRIMTSALNGALPTPYNVFQSPFNGLNPASGDWTIRGASFQSPNAVSVGSTANNTEIRCGSSGTISLSGGSSLLSGTNGGSAGQNLVLTINGTPYKIALLNM